MNRSLLALILGFSMVVSGCKFSAIPRQAAMEPLDPHPFRVLSQLPPASRAEAEDFGKRLEKAFRQQDETALRKLLRSAFIVDRVLDEYRISEKLQRILLLDPKINTTIGETLLKEYRGGSDFKFLGLGEQGDRACCRFRLIAKKGGANYLIFPIVRYEDGELGPEDILNIWTGMYVTEFVAIISRLKMSVDDPKSTFAGTDRQKALLKAFQDHAENFSAAEKSKNAQATLIAYQLLPAELRKENLLILMALKGAKAESERTVLDLVKFYRETYPTESSIDLLYLEDYPENKNYAARQIAIDRLLTNLGADGYLLMLKAKNFAKQNRFEEALTTIDQAISQEPDFIRAKATKVSLLIETKQFAAAAVENQKLSNLDPSPNWLDGMKDTPNWQAFKQSDEYKQTLTAKP